MSPITRAALTTALGVSLAWGTAAASAVPTFAPTDTGVNILGTSTLLSGGTFGFFDNNNTTYSTGSGYLPISPQGDNLSYGPTSPVNQTTGTFTVTNDAGDSTQLTGGPYFTLAFNSGTGFRQPDSYACNAASESCTLSWTGSGSTLAVDLQTVPAPASVPVPAAAWLMGSGLVGLVAVGRRKRKAC